MRLPRETEGLLYTVSGGGALVRNHAPDAADASGAMTPRLPYAPIRSLQMIMVVGVLAKSA
jgi:hypothetical protein